jgi:nicotinic acid mononucleotide adenylyltransferase
MWFDKLKELGVNIHVIATGAGAGIQNALWEVPGSSAYLGGAQFPYAPEEQEELLGFMPEHFCSEEVAVDLASAAYMKAYKFGGKKPVGVGLTASVASEKIHRGDHRIFVCIITDDVVRTAHFTLEKKVGIEARYNDGQIAELIAFDLLIDIFDIPSFDQELTFLNKVISDSLPERIQRYKYQDRADLAKERFFAHPFFDIDGRRHSTLLTAFRANRLSLYPGAFNPPHEGHFGIATSMFQSYGKRVIFEVTAEPPHKEPLTVQQLLQRAKLLQKHDRFFTRHEPYYIDKARSFPGVGLVLGADAMVRLLDPKWGHDYIKMFQEFHDLGTTLFVVGRDINGKFVSRDDIYQDLSVVQPEQARLFSRISVPLSGEWNISSTELRNQVIAGNK